jgi:hypothetical protein
LRRAITPVSLSACSNGLRRAINPVSLKACAGVALLRVAIIV